MGSWSMDILPETEISQNLVSATTFWQRMDLSGIVHGAQQYDRRALCKFAERFANEMDVQPNDVFRRPISHVTIVTDCGLPGLCNTVNQSKTHLSLKSRKISFVYYDFSSCL